MPDNPSDPNSAGASPGDPEINQADIDALFGGGSPEASAPDESAAREGAQATPEAADDSAAQAEPVTQADIDALLGVAADAEGSTDGGGDAASSAAEADSGSAADATSDTPPQAEERLDTLGRPFDAAAAEMAAAMAAEQAESAAASPPAAPAPPAPIPAGAEPMELTAVADEALASADAKSVSMLNDVNLRVRIQLGRTRMLVEDVLNLGEGSVVELDKLAGDPVDVLVNGRLIARGEVLVLNDSFCVRVSEVLSHDPHRVSA